jgi:hypothetical protein
VGEDRYSALLEAMLKSGEPQNHQLTERHSPARLEAI